MQVRHPELNQPMILCCQEDIFRPRDYPAVYRGYLGFADSFCSDTGGQSNLSRVG